MTLATDLKIIMSVLGGIGLFLYGMELVTKSLSEALGPNLRLILQRVTSNRVLGLLGGTAVASLLFSGPTTVMVVNFVNAGLIALREAIPIIFGANVGTTIALQLISLDLTPYALSAIGIAVAARMATSNATGKSLALTLMGFGLIFLGLSLMSQAMAPLKQSEFLRDFLLRINSETIGGLCIGIFTSMILTALVMSSGAIIAMTFALASVGLLTGFDQVFPILLGAHIGTCLITLIGAIGTTPSARRTAYAHLSFNVLGSVTALVMMRWYLWLIPHTSTNLIRQIANGHTIIQATNAVLFLPFTGLLAKLIEKVTKRGDGEEEERSYLDPAMVRTPELALLLAIREIRRQARIAQRMLRTSMEAMLSLDLSKFQEVAQDENSVDEIKKALDHYFVLIGERQLSRRQSVLLQHLVSSSNDLERVADHIETIGLLTRTKVRRQIWFEDESMLRLVELSRLVSDTLEATVDSLDISQPDARERAQKVLLLRKEYKRRAREIKTEFNSRLFTGAEDAIHGMFFMRYITVFDRIMRHVRAIARVELEGDFRIKEMKFDIEAPLQKPVRVAPANGKGGLDESALFVESPRDQEEEED